MTIKMYSESHKSRLSMHVRVQASWNNLIFSFHRIVLFIKLCFFVVYATSLLLVMKYQATDQPIELGFYSTLNSLADDCDSPRRNFWPFKLPPVVQCWQKCRCSWRSNVPVAHHVPVALQIPLLFIRYFNVRSALKWRLFLRFVVVFWKWFGANWQRHTVDFRDTQWNILFQVTVYHVLWEIKTSYFMAILKANCRGWLCSDGFLELGTGKVTRWTVRIAPCAEIDNQ